MAILKDEVNKTQEAFSVLEEKVKNLRTNLRAASQHRHQAAMGLIEAAPDIIDQIPEMIVQIRQLRLEKLHTGWSALIQSLAFAAQGGSCLMEHPGYLDDFSSEGLAYPLTLEDISTDLRDEVKAHAQAIKPFMEIFSEALSVVEEKLANFQTQTNMIAECRSTLAGLREQRRQASACGEDTEKLGTAIIEATAELKKSEEAVAHLEDDMAGLLLRQAELLKAKEQGEKAIRIFELYTEMIELCFRAQEYNAVAQETTARYDQFKAQKDKVLFAANQLGHNAQEGIPCPHWGTSTFKLPTLGLTWLTDCGTGFVSAEAAIMTRKV